MTLHGAAPGDGGVEGRIVRFAAYGGGIEKRLSAHQGHGPSRFWIPLVPTYPHTQAAKPRVPDTKASIAGAEVIFLLVAWTIGDVALAIDAEQSAIRVDHDQAVKIMRTFTLEDRDRQHHAKLSRQGCEGLHARVVSPGMSLGEPALVLGNTKIGALKKLRRQYDLGAARRRLTDHVRHERNVGVDALAEWGLQGGEGEGARHQAGSCWLMQWKEPPPLIRAVEERPITSRPGKTVARASTALAPIDRA